MTARLVTRMVAAVIAVAVLALAPAAATEAATCANATGPIAFQVFSLASNPVCSGQDIFLYIRSQNCSGQSQNARRVIEVLDGTGQVILTPFDFPYTQPSGAFGFTGVTVLTAGAPAFSGRVRLTDYVGGQVSDVVELPLVIVPPCPTLPSRIPPYVAQ